MNKTLVTDSMCIIHTFHFTGKAVTASTAWSHPTLDRDCITSENISTLRRCGLWTGNTEMKPNVLPKMFLAPLVSESAANPHLSLFLGSLCSSAQRTKPHVDHHLCSKGLPLSFWLLGQISVQTVRPCLLSLFLQQFQQSIVTSLFFCPKLSFYVLPHC